VNSADMIDKMEKGFDMGQAVAEADRCLLCYDAPCSIGCPANTDPGTFIRKLRLKNITGAIRTIKQNNILGGACGVLCPTDRLCEKACSAVFKSEEYPNGMVPPIQIGKIQRFLIEHSWETGINVLEKGDVKKEKVAVVGSGPSGLSCAAELAQEGYPVTVFEAKAEPGGVLRYGIAPFRFSQDFLQKEVDEIKALGVEFKCNRRIEGDKAAENLLEQGYKAVYLAPGLWKAAQLKSNPIKIKGLYSSIDYLASIRDGRLEETTSHVAGKIVAVIGGGAVAMDCVATAYKLGAKDVYLIYRRSYTQMPAEKHELIESLEMGVHFLLLNQPIDYLTDDQQQLTQIKCVRTELGEPDDSGRRRPLEIAGTEWTMDVDMVIEALGNQSEDALSSIYPNVEIKSKGLIKANAETAETSVPGIFAGGDIVRGPALVVNAVQDGKNAAQTIQKYLSK